MVKSHKNEIVTSCIIKWPLKFIVSNRQLFHQPIVSKPFQEKESNILKTFFSVVDSFERNDKKNSIDHEFSEANNFLRTFKTKMNVTVNSACRHNSSNRQ